jgi:hypothetical protein
LRMQAQSHQQQMQQNSSAERLRQQQWEYIRTLNSRRPTACSGSQTGGGSFSATCW